MARILKEKVSVKKKEKLLKIVTNKVLYGGNCCKNGNKLDKSQIVVINRIIR